MQYKTLSNGVKMPMLGLGTFKVTEGEAYDTVLEALKLGYRHIDTAQIYGNEASVGKAIKDSQIPREDIFVTTKLSPINLGYEEAKKELMISLEKLGLDYVDLYLIHWPSPSTALNQSTWRGMEEVYDKKLTRAIGVSNFKIHHMDALLKTARIVPMANQIELHPGLYQIPTQIYLNEKNIALISYGPFMKGEVFLEEGPYFKVLKGIADKYQKTIAQVIIAWGIQRGILMIPKSVTPKRLKENLESQDLFLTIEELASINQLNRGKRVYTDPDNNSFVKQA